MTFNRANIIAEMIKLKRDRDNCGRYPEDYNAGYIAALNNLEYIISKMETERPRIIVEVDGGMVQRVLSDRKVDVDVLDMDNYNISDDEEEISAYEDMICEASLLQKVW